MATDTRSQQHNILKGYNMLLYFAGSMIMYEPDEECITDFWKKGILKNLPVSSTNPNFIKAASQLRDSCADINICKKKLSEDYTRLFTRQELPLAPAYESFYRNKGQPGSGHKGASVTEFYNSYGWKSGFRKKTDNDHLGIELLFLTILIEKYLVLNDKACRAEMKNEIQRFLDQHILCWVHKWNKNIQHHAKTFCYKGIGTLIFACVEDIYSFFENNLAASQKSEYLKN